MHGRERLTLRKLAATHGKGDLQELMLLLTKAESMHIYALIGTSQELNNTPVQLGFHMHYMVIRAFSEKFKSTMTTVKRA